MNTVVLDVNLGKSNEQKDPAFIGKWDIHTLRITSDHILSPAEAAVICKSEMEKNGYDMVCAVSEIAP